MHFSQQFPAINTSPLRVIRLEMPARDGYLINAVILNKQQRNLEEIERYLQEIYPNLRQNCETDTLNCTLALMRIEKGETDILCIADSTKEWETAAAHAILNELDKNLYDFKSKVENSYNKPDLNNNSVIAR